MTITDKYKNFLKNYKKKVCERTYRRYKDNWCSDEYIFKTDLRNWNHYTRKDTLVNKHKAFIKRTWISMSYVIYWKRITKENYTEEMLEKEWMRNSWPKLWQKRGSYNQYTKEDLKTEKRFKPIIRQTLEVSDDPYYLT